MFVIFLMLLDMEFIYLFFSSLLSLGSVAVPFSLLLFES